MTVYRYREDAPHNLEALKDNSINGSLFRVYNDKTELNFDIRKTTIKRFGISPDEKKKIIALLVNNIRENYYLACFSLVSPYSKSHMWQLYAKKGCGYCLAYSEDDLVSAIRNPINKWVTLKPVRYSFDRYCLDKVIENMCSYKKGVRKELEAGDYDMALAKTSESVRKQYVKALLHKSAECMKESEIRMILQSSCQTGTSIPTFNPCILRVKPRKIIISDGITAFGKMKLIEYAKKECIPYEIIENPCKAFPSESSYDAV